MPEDQAIAERSTRALRCDDAVATALGIAVEDVGPGTATTRLRVTATMTNGLGGTQGGYVFLLADTAAACAGNSRGAATVASGCDIDPLEPTTVGDELVAVAQERVLRGRSGIDDVRVTCAGRTVAEFRGRSRALRAHGADSPDPPRAETSHR